jgi:serine/threonine protein kinase/uncharacterized membrane protein YhaH (DUF805 family)
MKCAGCQTELRPDARFCGSCGKPVPVAAAPEIDLAGLRTIEAAETRQPSRSEQKRLEPGETFAGRYVIVQLIGEGGMGVVYRARDKLTETEVALKLIRADRLAGQDAVKRLIREGVTSRDIRHPNVVAVYDVGESDGQPFISMEFLGGRSLRAWNRDRMQGPDWSLTVAVNIIREILAGLEAAHTAGVVHRDLKPENVILLSEPTDERVQLKLLDFGIARAPNTGDTGATSLGTRGYMAPEQVTAPDAAKESADLYALSVMFYELLVGVVPQNFWQAPSGGRADVPVAIDKLIEKGLSPNPRVRPQSVAEYRQALHAALGAKSKSETITAGSDVQDLVKKTVDFINTGGGVQRDVFNRKPVETQGGDAQHRTLWQWFTFCLTKKFVTGTGRAHRREYWGFNLGAFALTFAAGVVDGIEATSAGYYDSYGGMAGEPAYVYSSVAWLLFLAPSIAVASRRLHDIGKSGWIAALLAVPLLGFAAAVLIGLPAGQRGDNGYGPDPLGGERADT